MIQEIAGGVTAANGYKAAGLHCGIKRAKKDLALLVSERPAACGAVFTQNAVPGAPVTVCKEQLAGSRWIRAVAVNSGGTLVLGGLIKDDRTTDVTGIPILSQIPYLGILFGTTDKNLIRTELVVLLTPRVVQQKRELDGITQEFKRKLTGLYEELSITPQAPRR